MTQLKMEQPSQERSRPSKNISATAMVWVCADSRYFVAGALSPQGFQSLAAAVKRHWPVSTQKDFNRYVGLVLDNSFYILHAEHLLQKDCVLGLVFPLKTPLSCIRQNMTQLLSSHLPSLLNQFEVGNPLERSLQFILQSNSEADPGWLKPDNQSAETIEDVHLPEKMNIEPEENEADAVAKKKTLHTSSKTRQPKHEMISPSGIPADLTLEVSDTSWQPVGENWLASDEKTLEPHRSSFEEGSDRVRAGASAPVWQPLVELQNQEDDLVSLLQDDYDLREDLEMSDEERFVPATSVDPVLDERLSRSDNSIHTDNVDLDLLAWTEEVSDVTFYLVPGHDNQYLLGDLAHRLRDWLPTICTTYGWELDFLSIRPDYMKWTLRDFPESLILEMLRIVREQLSEKIFRLFPHLFPDNQIKDFWSPGYLVDTQNREFSTQALITHVSSGRLAHSNPR